MSGLRLLVAVGALMSTACNSSRGGADWAVGGPAPRTAARGGSALYDAAAIEADQLGGAQPSIDRVIIRTAQLSVEAKDVPLAQAEVERIVAGVGGRVTRSSDFRSTISMTLRIPDERLESTLDSIGALGTVRSRGISAEDVTTEVIDLDARIKALETSRDRLRALHERTNTVEEIIAVERELARVTGELDSLNGRLRQLRTDDRLSTVMLSIRQAQVLGPLGVVFYGAGKLIGKLFVWR